MHNKSILVVLGGLLPKRVKRTVSNIVIAFHGIEAFVYKCFRRTKTFTFRGNTYQYIYSGYSRSWQNERAVEVPIIWKTMRENRNKRILEVGNVLSHHFRVSHDCIDKYEKNENVINEDVVTYEPSEKYDLIISISTLEHVGWDERDNVPREPFKILQALDHLTGMLNANGMIIATWSVAYNTELDKLLDDNKLPFTNFYYMKRTSWNNIWIETNWEEVRDLKYNFSSLFNGSYHGNGLVIAYLLT